MSPELQTLIFIVCLIAVVVIGTKTKTNMGIWAIAVTFILGICVAKLSTSTILGLFPSSIVINILLAAFFYGFATGNGTMEAIARRLFKVFHKATWFIPLMFFVVAFVLSIMGCNSDAILIFLSPIAFGMSISLGYAPIMAPLAIWAGGTAGTWAPWCLAPAMMTPYYATTFGMEVATEGFSKMFFILLIMMVLTVLLTYFITGSFKAKGSAEGLASDELAPLDKNQKITITVIIIVALLILIPVIIELIAPNPVTTWMKNNLTIQVLAAIGSIVFVITNVADSSEVLIKRVPWSLIFMLIGMGMLINLSKEMGFVDVVGNLLTSGSIPEGLVVPALFLICGILSFFVSGSVATPLLMPIAPLLAVGNISPVTILIAMQIGLVSSSISPVSQGGAMAISGCPDSLRNKMVTQQMTLGIINMVFWTILADLGIFNL